ncbi:MAG: exo-beta-N-acetylmuramidase NamZ domain-containing protein [Flavobacteriales bacterium]
MTRTIYALIILLIFSCAAQINPTEPSAISNPDSTSTAQDTSEFSCLKAPHPNFKTAAEQMNKVLPLLRNKRVGLVGNHSSLVNGVHLVDTLLSHGVALKRIFCPEHGFRGKAAAGAIIDDSKDSETGLNIISLHGKNKKPKLADFKDLDIILFDIQDVGARFYTYISTLHYVMETAAEAGVLVIVLDRPNPNGHYIDGPILNDKFQSFIGMHPVPIVHGMTIGEYAQMINGEGWLENESSCNLSVVPCLNYTHNTRYTPPIKPSPNLPNANSVSMYPSLCLFEGTAVSIGRGTDTPFQMYGHPLLKYRSFSFTPKSRTEAPDPKLAGENCFGLFYTDEMVEMVNNGAMYRDNTQEKCTVRLLLKPLIDCFKEINASETFFSRPDFFDLLAGSDDLRLQIIEGKSEEEIRNSWTKDLEAYKKMRSSYTIYP